MVVRIHTVRRCVQAIMLILIAAGVVSFSPVFFILMAVIGVFFGPVFCGWFCPFGFIQELAGKAGVLLRKRLGIKVPDLPYQVRYVRIAAALLIITGTAAGFIRLEEGNMEGPLFSLLFTVVIVLNLFWTRFFCRTVCPMGAMLGLCNLIKVFPVRVQSSCTGCVKCSRACPMGVSPDLRGDNRDIGCISCLECCDACPVKSGLTVPGKKKRNIFS